jgi:hypothetical protein
VYGAALRRLCINAIRRICQKSKLEFGRKISKARQYRSSERIVRAPNTGPSFDDCEPSMLWSATMLSRRDLLAASAMGAAMTVSAANAGSFGNPDEPPEGAINAKIRPASLIRGRKIPQSGISCSPGDGPALARGECAHHA